MNHSITFCGLDLTVDYDLADGVAEINEVFLGTEDITGLLCREIRADITVALMESLAEARKDAADTAAADACDYYDSLREDYRIELREDAYGRRV